MNKICDLSITGLTALTISFWILQISLASAAASGPALQSTISRQQRGFNIPSSLTDPIKQSNFFEPFATSFRLPNDTVQPISYQLNIVPILNESPGPQFDPFTAPGSVTILVQVLSNDVTNISMHKDRDMVAVSGVQVSRKSDGQPVAVIGWDYDENGLYVIRLAVALIMDDEYEIFLEYVAQINNFRRGLFRAEYMDEDGNQKWLAATHFESVSYRKMSVGFDEPHLKAVFNICIGRSLDRMSISNSDIKESGVEDPTLRPLLPQGYVWDKFNPTVPMSTYLVALVVSDYARETADPAIYPKPVNIYGPPHLINRGAGLFAANRAAELLKFYEEIFNGIEYAMPKLDSAAIPRTYFPGAMENYGLNIYGDGALLYLDGESLEIERESLAVTLAHEIAHQWVGNLVTCSWWSNLWLNEGWANYISYLGAKTIANEYDAEGSLLYDVVHETMEYDVTEGSHPIVNEGNQQMVEGMTIFDSITYGKGASVIRMMEGFLTRKTLLAGLSLYLERMKFQSAEQDDLFESLNQVAHAENRIPPGTHLKDIMHTFTLQTGLPLIRVQGVSADTVYISQEKFLLNTKNRENDPNRADTLWEIPVIIATQDDPNFGNHTPKFWMSQQTIVMSYPHDISKWIIVNPEGFGYYRVLYDEQLTGLIQTQLKADHSILSSMTKSQLINDYFNVAESGYISYETALGMTSFLGQKPEVNDHHVFWYPASDALKKLLPLITTDATAYTNFKMYLLPKVESALNQTGWTPLSSDEHGVNVLIRTILLDWACALDSPRCQELANGLLKIWLEVPDNNPVPLDLQEVLYCAGVAGGPDENFQFILTQYQLDPRALGQRTRLVKALTCSQNEADLNWLLENGLNASHIKKDDLTQVLQGLGENSKIGRNLLVKFLYDKWPLLVGYMASDPDKVETTIISDVVDRMSVYLNEEADLNNLDNLMMIIQRDNPVHYSFIRRSLEASYTRMEKNVQWTENNLPGISDWLEANA